jgi:TRAP-type uncharacterized transport system fused permease subunit
MMSMVTPPVALAAYTASAIAESSIMKTGLAAFRFALVGFALPYCFVLNPELLLLAPEGQSLAVSSVIASVILTALGILPLAAAVTGRLTRPLNFPSRAALVVSSGLLLFARNTSNVWIAATVGIMITVSLILIPALSGRRSD